MNKKIYFEILFSLWSKNPTLEDENEYGVTIL